MNLLQETIKAMNDSGHAPEDVIFIGSEKSGHSCSWLEFQAIADAEYHAGYGVQEVADDLIIVFDDGSRMWRHEYDGSECWDYVAPFVAPKETKKITRLIVPKSMIGWKSLEAINEIES